MLRSSVIRAALLGAVFVSPASAQDSAPARQEVAEAATEFEQQAERTAEVANEIESASPSEVVSILRDAELNGVGTAWFARMRISDLPVGSASIDEVTASARAEVVELLRKQSESLGEFAGALQKVAGDLALDREQAIASLEAIEAPFAALIVRGSPAAAAPDLAAVDVPSALHTIGPGALTTSDYPSVAAIYTNPSDPRVTCTGTLVSPRVVVTAAHCLRGPRGRPPVAVFFQHAGRFEVVDHDVHDPWGQHPWGFVPGTEQAFNDIAVLQLDRPVTTIRPAEILPPGMLRPGAQGTIVGFGARNALGVDGSPIMDAPLVWNPGIKMAGIVETRLCDGIAGLLVRDGRICWEYKGDQAGSATVCSGDSGGPLFTFVGGRWYLAGVTSFGLGGSFSEPCPASSVAVDTDLNAHRDYVMEQIARFDPAATTFPTTALQPVVNEPHRILVGRFERLLGLPANTSLQVKGTVGALSVGINGTQRSERVYLSLIDPEGREVCQEGELPPMVHCVQLQPQAGKWRVRVVGAAQQEVQLTAFLF